MRVVQNLVYCVPSLCMKQPSRWNLFLQLPRRPATGRQCHLTQNTEAVCGPWSRLTSALDAAASLVAADCSSNVV
jgi:hypothetical protein